MKQKLEELKLMIQGSKKAKILVAFGILAVIFSLIVDTKPRTVRMEKPEKEEPSTLVAGGETPTDILHRVREEMEKIQAQTSEIGQQLIETKNEQTQQEERVAEIMRRMIERIETAESKTVAETIEPQELSGEDENFTEEEQSFEDEQLEPFGEAEQPVAPAAMPPTRKVAFIGAGDSVRVKLISGVNAPTDGTPYPVVLTLASDVYGPDGSALPLGGARLIAAAQGSLTDSRALFRLTSLNVRFPSGRRQVYEVDGWIVGEDGIRGLPGVLHDPAGEAIGWSAVVGGIQGAGRGLRQANQSVIQNNQGTGFSVITDGNLGQFMTGSAVSGAAQEVSQILRNRINQMVPVVEVLSGREATAVFAKNLAIDGLFEELEEDLDGNSFASLD